MGNFRRANRLIPTACCVLVLAVLAPWSLAASYLNRFWQTGEGMPSNNVSGVVRDDQGFLWVATGAGLARFDGLRFEVFAIAQGLPDSQILSLHKDRRGRIWAGTRHGVAYRENGAWHPLADGPRTSVFSLGEARDGSIWIGTYDGCWRWADGRAKPVDLGGIAADIRAFLDDGFGGLWILTRSHLCRWYPDQPGKAEPVPGPWSGYDLYDLCRDGEGRRVIVGTGLLLRENRGDWEDLGESLPEGKAGANLACARGADGGLWIATRDRGALVLHSEGWTRFDSTSQLSLDDVRNVFVDDEGLVWLGTNGGGLNLLRRRAFDSYAAREGLGRTVTSALVIDTAGTVWAGTDGSGILRFAEGRFEPAFPPESLPGGTGLIWSLCAARDGSLWAGTYREGLLRIRNGAMERITLPGAGAGQEITALHEMHDGSLLVGVASAGIHRWADGKIEPFADGPRLPELRVHDLLEDRGGDVWAACGSQGLWRGSGGGWTRVGDEPGGDPLNPVALLEDREGGLWIGTLGQGLIRHHQGTLRRWTRNQGLVSDTIVQLLEDPERNLWLGSDNGLQRLTRAELDSGSRLTGLRLGREDGLPTPQFSGEHGNLSAAAADGSLWFSLASGAIHLDPKEFSAPPASAVARIVSAETDQGVLWQRQGAGAPQRLVVPAGAGTLRIRFTAPEFVTPERLRFRCRMEGLEKEWQEIELSRTVSYASLPPGNYAFNLMVAGRDGRWSAVAARVPVQQQPHFWQRLDFRIAAAVGLAVLLALAVSRWSRRRLRRKLDALRQERRVEMERARIARDLHDDLGASLTEINFLGTLAGGGLVEGPARDKVLGMVERARQMAKSLDEIVWTVNPRNDTLASTVHYLCSRVRESLSAADIRCRLVVDEGIPECSLDSQQRHHLLMSVNEAVNNVMKHSGARELVFTLRFAPGLLRAEIADNGGGFLPDATSPERNGLRNMRRRMESAGGSIRISSSTAGTVVSLELPIQIPK